MGRSELQLQWGTVDGSVGDVDQQTSMLRYRFHWPLGHSCLRISLRKCI